MQSLYQKHLRASLSLAEWLLLSIVLELLQRHQWVRLESLANQLPLPIKLESRRKKLQRFLERGVWEVEKLWFPIVKELIKHFYQPEETLYLVLDRTQWKSNNLLIVSIIYQKRAIPIYWQLKRKKGNSSVAEQKEVLEKVLELLKENKKVVLGDREFCGVELGKWLKREKRVDFAVRLKKSEYVEVKAEFKKLENLSVKAGSGCYLGGVKVTKSKGFGEINVVIKKKRTYRKKKTKEAWYIMTSLGSIEEAIEAYKKRMGIEEMFRDFKKGGYNLEETQVTEKRLLSLILLVSMAYTEATVWGKEIREKGVSEYVGRRREAHRRHRRHSNFYIGLRGKEWVESQEMLREVVEELLSLAPQKRPNYRRGRRAAMLILSTF